MCILAVLSINEDKMLGVPFRPLPESTPCLAFHRALGNRKAVLFTDREGRALPVNTDWHLNFDDTGSVR